MSWLAGIDEGSGGCNFQIDNKAVVPSIYLVMSIAVWSSLLSRCSDETGVGYVQVANLNGSMEENAATITIYSMNVGTGFGESSSSISCPLCCRISKWHLSVRRQPPRLLSYSSRKSIVPLQLPGTAQWNGVSPIQFAGECFVPGPSIKRFTVVHPQQRSAMVYPGHDQQHWDLLSHLLTGVTSLPPTPIKR